MVEGGRGVSVGGRGSGTGGGVVEEVVDLRREGDEFELSKERESEGGERANLLVVDFTVRYEDGVGVVLVDSEN